MARYLHEPSKNGSGILLARSICMCAFGEAYPALFEHLTEPLWESGKPRTTSTLMLFCEEGLGKVCLHDRSASRTGWCSGDSLTSALVGLEALLVADGVEWRRDRAPKSVR